MQVLVILFVSIFFEVKGSNDDAFGPKIVLNAHLFIWYEDRPTAYGMMLSYLCLNHEHEFQQAKLNLSTITSISIGRLQNASQLYFLVSGMNNSTFYLSKVTVNCFNDQIEMEMIVFKEFRYSVDLNKLAMVVDPYGRYAIVCGQSWTLFYDLVHLKHSSKEIEWLNSKNFFPISADLTVDFLYVVGCTDDDDDDDETNPHLRFTHVHLYLIKIDWNLSEYNLRFVSMWMSDRLKSLDGDLLFLSLSVHSDANATNIVVGIPPINTIHLFSHDQIPSISFEHIGMMREPSLDPEFRHIKAVTWLNDGEILAVLDTNIFPGDMNFDSRISYYRFSKNKPFSTNLTLLSIFPNQQQNYPKQFESSLRYLMSSLSSPSTLYGCNADGKLLFLPPSLPGYYSVSFRSIEDTLDSENQFYSLIPDRVQCSPGTYKSDAGVWPCVNCTNATIGSSCPQCLNRTACPLEVIDPSNDSIDVEQTGIYPDSPEIDLFDDVLIFYLFQIKWNFEYPFLLCMILLSIVLIVAGLMIPAKFSQRFLSKRKLFETLFRHFDLIEQGQLWFGGLISLTLFVLVIFAARFAHLYHQQYPIEKKNDFLDLSNSKFDTNLQLLSPYNKQYHEIFHLLNSQKFTLNIELINSLIHCGQINVKAEEHQSFLPFSCSTKNRNLYFSIELTVHNLNLQLFLSREQTIESIRISGSGPDAKLNNIYIQTWNFSKGFQQTNRILSNNLLINLQLTKSINITEGLTENDPTTYMGLWIPTFIYDQDQLFTHLNSSKNKPETILLLRISETPFFIRNKQKPIARRSEIIFHTILFILVCIDLISMMLLILKLWFIPLIIFHIRKFFHHDSFIHRLVNQKKNDSNLLEQFNSLQNQMNNTKEQMDRLIRLINLHLEIKQTTDNQELLSF